ncbi:MAG: cyclic nucleotide-binding domain-containing protein, partial [Pirellulales bacterium]
MSAAEISESAFKQVPIFKNMNDTERRQLLAIAKVQEFSQGEVILRQGKSSQNMWVLIEGECEVIKEPETSHTGEQPVRLALLEPHNNFGEMSFFHPAPHSATVRALTNVRVLRIEREDFEELVQEGCSAAYRLGCYALD